MPSTLPTGPSKAHKSQCSQCQQSTQTPGAVSQSTTFSYSTFKIFTHKIPNYSCNTESTKQKRNVRNQTYPSVSRLSYNRIRALSIFSLRCMMILIDASRRCSNVASGNEWWSGRTIGDWVKSALRWSAEAVARQWMREMVTRRIGAMKFERIVGIDNRRRWTMDFGVMELSC